VVTDAAIGREALALHDDYSPSRPGSDFDHEERLLVDMDNRAFPLLLRRGDIFLASAWWNAAQAFELRKSQSQYFSREMPFVYLIQDFEANFSGWSTQWALAENTYRQARDAIAIINSNELHAYMMEKYKFSNALLLPYVPNRTIVEALVHAERKRQILIYGRPSVVRNCFELLLNGLREWQSRHPVEAARWDIVSVGEEYPVDYGHPVQNLSVFGKVDLSAYGKLLSESSVGISLMVSPHPSYPPLEMAQAGLVTITNKFENKDLSTYGDAILNIESFRAEALADAIELAVMRVGQAMQRPADEASPLRVPPPCGEVVDYDRLGNTLRELFREAEYSSAVQTSRLPVASAVR